MTAGTIRKLIINMPPRHGKSLLVAVLWPAWVWTTNPAARFLFCSYAQSLSNRDSRKFRNLITSAWYRSRWGTRVFSLKGDRAKRAVKEIENDQMGHRVASSPGGEGTGRGGTYVICDDPNKVKDAESKKKRDAVNEWWSGEMTTRGNVKHAAKVIVQQRVHHQDLTGFITNDPENPDHGYCLLKLPAEYEGDKAVNALGFRDPRVNEGDLLWPQGCDAERLIEIKRGFKFDAYKIAGQLQQRPVPREGGQVKKAWLKRFSAAPAEYDYKFIVADFSGGSVREKASSNAFGVFLVKGRDLYLIEVECLKAPYALAKKRFMSLAERHPDARAKIIEDTVLGRALMQDDSHGLRGLIPIAPGSKDKGERLEICTPMIEAGYYHVPVDGFAGWVTGYVFELCHFPLAASDDQVDMTSMAITYFQRPKRKVRVSVLGGRR